MNNKQKHLDYIQATITRMATNSRSMKNMFLFSLVFVTLIPALSTKVISHQQVVCLSWFVALLMNLFAYFDAFYLQQERIFIKKYNEVRKLDEEDIDFSMDTYYLKKEMSLCRTFFSATIIWWYAPITLLYTNLILII